MNNTAHPQVCSWFDRSWVRATAITIVIDVVLRKPISIMARGGIQTFRDVVSRPEEVYIGKGRNRVPLSQI